MKQAYSEIGNILTNLRITLNSNRTETVALTIHPWGRWNGVFVDFTPVATGEYYLDIWSNEADSPILNLQYIYLTDNYSVTNIRDDDYYNNLYIKTVRGSVLVNDCNTVMTVEYVKDKNIEVSPAGVPFLIKQNNNGEVETEPLLRLPSDFPKFVTRGKSRTEGNYSVQMAHSKYAFMLNKKGQVTMFIKSKTTNIALLQKHTVSNGQVLYSYLRFMNNEDPRYPKLGDGIGYEQVEMIVLDEKLKRIGEPIKCKAYEHIEPDYPAEFHDSLILDKNHYMIISYHAREVINIPGYEGIKKKVLEAVIQEQKDGEVVFQWASGDYADLYSDSYTANNFEKDYQDYAHINSIEIDPKDNNIIASFRHLGVMKINRISREIMWKLSGKSDEFGLVGEQIFSHQHDARITDEGTLTVFANNNDLEFAGDTNTRDNVSRILEFKLDEKSKRVLDFKYYNSKKGVSPYMGNAQKLDCKGDVYLTCWVVGATIERIQEVNIANGKIEFALEFKDKTSATDVYRCVKYK